MYDAPMYRRIYVVQVIRHSRFVLFRSLIDFVQEARKHLPSQVAIIGARLGLRDIIDQGRDPLVRFLLIREIPSREADLLIHGLHLSLLFGVLATIALVENFALVGVCNGECDVDAPRAFVVDDVRPDLSDLFWCAVIV